MSEDKPIQPEGMKQREVDVEGHMKQALSATEDEPVEPEGMKQKEVDVEGHMKHVSPATEDDVEGHMRQATS